MHTITCIVTYRLKPSVVTPATSALSMDSCPVAPTGVGEAISTTKIKGMAQARLIDIIARLSLEKNPYP
jgi:hypothetical protein